MGLGTFKVLTYTIQIKTHGKNYAKPCFNYKRTLVYCMAIQVVEFSNGGYKIRKVFA